MHVEAEQGRVVSSGTVRKHKAPRKAVVRTGAPQQLGLVEVLKLDGGRLWRAGGIARVGLRMRDLESAENVSFRHIGCIFNRKCHQFVAAFLVLAEVPNQTELL
jgi:hypothetical protein